MNQLDAQFMDSIRPFEGLVMKRLGNKNDGGYVVPQALIENTKVLISGGYGYDCKFEKEFLGLNKGLTCKLYDKDISVKVLCLNLIRQFRLLIFRKKSRVVVWSKALLRYIEMRLTPRLKYKVLEIAPKQTSSRNIALDQIIEASLGRGQVMLKLDIEGAEYECLSSAFPQIRKLAGLTIEFHSVSTRQLAFKQLLNQLKSDFVLVNTHINNYASTLSGIPEVVELTFINNAILQLEILREAASIPSALDAPNNPKSPDITFRYS